MERKYSTSELFEEKHRSSYFDYSKQEERVNNVDDDSLESASQFGERINNNEKLREVYRLALKKEDSNYSFVACLFSVLFVSFAAILTVQIVNMSLSSENSQLPVMIGSAPLPIVGLNVLMEARIIQQHLLLGIDVSDIIDSTRERVTEYVKMIDNMMQVVQGSYFNDQMKKDWMETTNEIYVPAKTAAGVFEYTVRNMTIVELMHQLFASATVVSNFDIDQFNETVESYGKFDIL